MPRVRVDPGENTEPLPPEHFRQIEKSNSKKVDITADVSLNPELGKLL